VQQIAPRGSCSQIIPPCEIDAELLRDGRRFAAESSPTAHAFASEFHWFSVVR
jgi:hypothetical protein